MESTEEQIARLTQEKEELLNLLTRHCACLWGKEPSLTPEVECATHAVLRRRYERLRDQLSSLQFTLDKAFAESAVAEEHDLVVKWLLAEDFPYCAAEIEAGAHRRAQEKEEEHG